MKKTFVLIFILAALPAYPAFDNIDVGGRTLGMGNAFTSIADDTNGFVFNPAGAGFIENRAISFTYTKPYLDISELNSGYVGVAVPLVKSLSLGAYINYMSETVYSERTVGILIGYKYALSDKQLLSAGVAVKNMSKDIGSSELIEANPLLLNKRSTFALGIDAGAILRIEGLGSIGISVLNINEPDVYFISSDPVPRKIKGGISGMLIKDLLVAGDFTYMTNNYDVNIGAEYKLGPTFTVRGGGEAGIAGSSMDYKLNFGIGYIFEFKEIGMNLGLDYGFRYPLASVEGTLGTHIMSISLREVAKKITEETKQ